MALVISMALPLATGDLLIFETKKNTKMTANNETKMGKNSINILKREYRILQLEF